MMSSVKYPVGIQTFKNMIEDGYAYVDKTRYVFDLAQSGKFFFLSRPRRFGKSLLLSTFESYYKGNRALFHGLDVDRLENDWVTYPVLRFDLSGIYAKSTSALQDYIKGLLSNFAEIYGVGLNSYDSNIGPLFGTLINKVSAKTGKKLVILIDEYDKGIVDVLDNSIQLQDNEDILRPFFSQLKIQEEYIQFCFITGVARFRHFTLFSGVNNIEDISLLPQYAAICGITESELTSKLHNGISKLAIDEGLTYKEALENLRYNYDGYRFTRCDDKVFNPFSLMLCLKNRCFDNYWLSSGTSKVFVTYLGKSNFRLSDLEDLWVSKERMEGIYTPDDPIPLMFQTGYLSIKNYNPISRFYRLGIPNGEVRRALVQEYPPISGRADATCSCLN